MRKSGLKLREIAAELQVSIATTGNLLTKAEAFQFRQNQINHTPHEKPTHSTGTPTAPAHHSRIIDRHRHRQAAGVSR